MRAACSVCVCVNRSQAGQADQRAHSVAHWGLVVGLSAAVPNGSQRCLRPATRVPQMEVSAPQSGGGGALLAAMTILAKLVHELAPLARAGQCNPRRAQCPTSPHTGHQPMTPSQRRGGTSIEPCVPPSAECGVAKAEPNGCSSEHGRTGVRPVAAMAAGAMEAGCTGADLLAASLVGDVGEVARLLDAGVAANWANDVSVCSSDWAAGRHGGHVLARVHGHASEVILCRAAPCSLRRRRARRR